MPRLASLIAAFVLALPGAAFAQGAGDDQYQDPFGDDAAQRDDRGGLTQAPRVGGGSGGSSSARSRSAGGGAATAGSGSGAAAGSGSAGVGSAGASGAAGGSARAASADTQGAAGRDQLPNTGTDPRILLLVGAGFVLAGVGLRLRTIDPDAF